MNMCKFLLSFSCFLVLSGGAKALDVSLEECVTEPKNITDISFVSYDQAIITTQQGGLYWFDGCDQEPRKIGSIDVSTSSWQLGLYSVAVDWSYHWAKRVYVYYTAEDDGNLKTRLSSFKLRPRFSSDVLSREKVILEIDQPSLQSNGGGLVFGPDGALYLGVGDGSDDGDIAGNAQDVTTLLGSILRIYPSDYAPHGYYPAYDNLNNFIPEARPEILAIGVRNPWKMTFDSQGNLIVADVGEDKIEEVSIIRAEQLGTEVLNLGWNIKEGGECFSPETDCDSTGLIDPVYQYSHYGDAGNSITGGETIWFEGSEYYLFADYITGYIGVLDLANPSVPAAETDVSGKYWTTFGKSYAGQVYVADYLGGGLYKVGLQP